MVNNRRSNMLRSSKKRFEVERVIFRRYHRRKVEYYVKWKGYSSLANTWEPEGNLNAAAIRAYNNPQPSLEAIEEGRDFLLCGIQKQLKSRSTVPTVISFRRDVFNYLFNGKGKPGNDRNSLLLERNDFNHFRNPEMDGEHIFDEKSEGIDVISDSPILENEAFDVHVPDEELSIDNQSDELEFPSATANPRKRKSKT
ncbi:uncharacterized protein LOC114521341 [Dendronephthya gigantea]|uniref:uncharacterized protein LOC114521341 n=1 Tax=Dendronephthya gigantea TaxID=151771 RepID=UPI00106DA0BB|nr:uncharacterized protein LOC114521341 [Dendronephthya gigantea]